MQVQMNDDLNLKFANCFVPSLRLTIRLVHRGTFIYVLGHCTDRGVIGQANGYPDLDDIKFLEVEDRYPISVRRSIGAGEKIGAFHARIALAAPDKRKWIWCELRRRG